MAGSLQGEHVFNAVGDLALGLLGTLRANISSVSAARAAAEGALGALETRARAFNQARDNADFRTADQGDTANSARYSTFSEITRKSIGDIISKNPSIHTQGYTKINQLLDNLDYYTTDQKAKTSRRDSFKGNQNKQQAFDGWYNSTRDLMYATFKDLRDAALAVNRTHT